MLDAKIITADVGEILHFGSTKIRILEDGSGTENRIGTIESTMAPNTKGPPRHLHLMHDECFLVTYGILRFRIGDGEHDAKAGDYVVVPVGVPHTFVKCPTRQICKFSQYLG